MKEMLMTSTTLRIGLSLLTACCSVSCRNMYSVVVDEEPTGTSIPGASDAQSDWQVGETLVMTASNDSTDDATAADDDPSTATDPNPDPVPNTDNPPPPNGEFIDLGENEVPPADSQEEEDACDCALDSPDNVTCSLFTVTTVLSVQSAIRFLPSRQWLIGSNESVLYTHTVFTGLDLGEHSIRLDYFSPDRSLYHQETLKFVVGDTEPEGEPSEYVSPIQHAEGLVVSYPLHLGTGVQNGGWRLATYIDDDTQPVNSTWFEIVESAGD